MRTGVLMQRKCRTPGHGLTTYHHCLPAAWPHRYHLKGSESWLFSTDMRKTMGNLEASGVPRRYLEDLEQYAEVREASREGDRVTA
jgi:hypothetical protein